MLLRDIHKDMGIAQANEIICRDIVDQEDSIIEEFQRERNEAKNKIEVTLPFHW